MLCYETYIRSWNPGVNAANKVNVERLLRVPRYLEANQSYRRVQLLAWCILLIERCLSHVMSDAPALSMLSTLGIFNACLEATGDLMDLDFVSALGYKCHGSGDSLHHQRSSIQLPHQNQRHLDP